MYFSCYHLKSLIKRWEISAKSLSLFIAWIKKRRNDSFIGQFIISCNIRKQLVIFLTSIHWSVNGDLTLPPYLLTGADPRTRCCSQIKFPFHTKLHFSLSFFCLIWQNCDFTVQIFGVSSWFGEFAAGTCQKRNGWETQIGIVRAKVIKRYQYLMDGASWWWSNGEVVSHFLFTSTNWLLTPSRRVCKWQSHVREMCRYST